MSLLRHALPVVAVFALATASLAACGGSDDDEGAEGAAGGSAAGSGGSSAGSGGAGGSTAGAGGSTAGAGGSTAGSGGSTAGSGGSTAGSGGSTAGAGGSTAGSGGSTAGSGGSTAGSGGSTAGSGGSTAGSGGSTAGAGGSTAGAGGSTAGAGGSTAGAGGSSGAGGQVGGCSTTGSKAACKQCCQTTEKTGYDFLIGSLVSNCACSASAPCATDCADNVCMGKAVSTACQTCLSAAGSANPPDKCVTAVQQACVSDQGCIAYATCDGGCKNLPLSGIRERSRSTGRERRVVDRGSQARAGAGRRRRRAARGDPGAEPHACTGTREARCTEAHDR